MDSAAKGTGGSGAGVNARQLLANGALELAGTQADNAAHDARALLAHLLGISPMELLAQDPEVMPDTARQFSAGVAQLAKGQPLQYIIKEAWFMGFPFHVQPHVLIPRLDTETVCQAALEVLPKGGLVLDLCTGSGALAVAVKKLRPDCAVHAADISEEALDIARRNAQANGADITFFQGDLFAPIQARYDMILCNPPYIPAGELDTLAPQVRREPRLALDGGEDGMRIYRRLIAEAPQYLKANGYLLCELGDNQAEAVTNLARKDFTDIAVFNDLGGLPRALRARIKEGKV